MNSPPQLGVEEEYQLVDPQTGRLVPNCKEVMRSLANDPDAEVQHELHLSQIEMASRVCETLSDVRRCLREVRGLLIKAAKRTGAELVAAGTNPLPLPESDDITPKNRYEQMAERYQQLARQLFIFGCHVHVSMPDKSRGVDVMNRSKRWLPALQAITANSPYWDGQDTGYASYRRELWAQWPLAGPPPHCHTVEDYEACIRDLIQSGAIKDASFLYWDIRLPEKVPTIEFRCADVMTSVEDTVGFAGLVRGIVSKAIADSDSGKPAPVTSDNVLRYAIWEAARFGTAGRLVDPLTCESLSSNNLLSRLKEEIRPYLLEAGDWNEVNDFLERVSRRGCGADLQRAHDGKDLHGVVCSLSEETARGVLQ